MTIFGLFFATFMYSRAKNRSVFAASSSELHLVLGTVNTVLLLTGSLFVALAIARTNDSVHGRTVAAEGAHPAQRLLIGGLTCGLAFVTIKAIEWYSLFSRGIAVGTGEFFTDYFMFTGIHLLHVLIGCTVLARLIAITRHDVLDAHQRMICEAGGIFWHMVDLLWIVLFALFYLMR
jgi:nitric oxide reductase NorE protein